MAAAVNSRTSPVPLFSLQKLVSVRTDGYEATSTPSASFLNVEEPKRTAFGSMMASLSSISSFAGIGGSGGNAADYASVPAQIATVAQGGYDGNAYFALYTSNST
jgi:hypothetical protein